MSHDVEEAYGVFGYDYERELQHHSSGMHLQERQSFLDQFQWTSSPDHWTLLRLFNQINSFYAETWALANLTAAPLDYLMGAHRRLLHRSGKQFGIRIGNIGFGVRAELPFGDVRRQFKLLQGIAPHLVGVVLDRWVGAVERGHQDEDTLVALMFALVAIHPFTDGNGRLGRLSFTWIGRRWGLPERWMAEAGDGEFLRTGSGLESTEYLMGEFLKELCGGNNRIRPGVTISPQEEAAAASELSRNLNSLSSPAAEVLSSLVFKRLREHLRRGGHFRSASPRFDCLDTVIAE